MSSKFQKVIILDSPIFLWRFWFLYLTFPLWLIFKRCVNFKGPKSCVQWYFRGTHTYTHALSEHRNPLLVSISLKSSNVPVFWRYVRETNHGLPISSFYRILQLYFLDHVQCIFDLIFMIDAHIFRAIFRVNVNCWYLLERVQFDSLSYGHLWLFASKWPYIIWTRIT